MHTHYHMTGDSAPIRDLDIILYGAYGCIGHLSAIHLAKQRELKWAIAGRNKTRLKALAATLLGPSSNPEIIVASLDGNITSWVERAVTIATAAGPFSVHSGEKLIEACAASGTMYADTSDEFYWQRRMIERHDAAAKLSGARITLAAGFCAVAAELGAATAFEHSPMPPIAVARAGGAASPARLSAWLERYSGGLSRGVIRTTHVNASYPKDWATDPYVLAPDTPTGLRVDTLVDGMRYPGLVSGEGLVVPNLFGDYDARFLRASFVARQQHVHLRVGSPTSQYSAWVAFLLKHRGSWASLTSCPDQKLLLDGSWRYRFVVGGGVQVEIVNGDTNGDDGASGHSNADAEVILSGEGDPGYHFTSVALAEVALCLAGKSDAGARCIGRAPGVLTPGLAVNTSALRARLETIGLLRTSVRSLGGRPGVRQQAKESSQAHERKQRTDLMVTPSPPSSPQGEAQPQVAMHAAAWAETELVGLEVSARKQSIVDGVLALE